MLLATKWCGRWNDRCHPKARHPLMIRYVGVSTHSRGNTHGRQPEVFLEDRVAGLPRSLFSSSYVRRRDGKKTCD
jgi:hypothetical protein